MNILALDLGTKTGWACIKDKEVQSGVQKFELLRGDTEGMRFLRFSSWLEEMIKLVKPKLIIYELPHHRGGHATALLVGMMTVVKMAVTSESSIELTSVHTATLKKASTGDGRASKGEMIEAAKRIHYLDIDIIDDNHADALLILEYGRKRYKEIR